MEATLVTSLDEVVDNVKQFNQDLQDGLDVITQLSMFKHWYYIPNIDMFGPSKYIGYKNMNTLKYDRGKAKTGVDTEKVLKRWFKDLSNGSDVEKEFKIQLIELLETYDMRLRSNACIHLPKQFTV
ncbi:hypothetical protein QGM71_20655 [Virgibacillus sp. C22-A2]|uniref:Uncharacterized protein n=1 Tax=Virgibacillus tibetensis TaxID=3042313 RepID=A0ABU6KMS6_9BACI|nr:hypothetical protein [Virgibacillus sp. C22-A2]